MPVIPRNFRSRDARRHSERAIDVPGGRTCNEAQRDERRRGRGRLSSGLGFDAGDGNLYRYVFNQPTINIDPTGLGEVTVVDKPDDNMIYFDETIKKGANQLKDPQFVKRFQDLGEFGKEILAGLQEYENMFINLQSLKQKKGLDIAVHYISGGPAGFAESAAKNGPCTISIFIGHGIYRPTVLPFLEPFPLNNLAIPFQPGQELVHPRVLKRVQDALGKAVPPPKPGDPAIEKAIPPEQAPRYGFFSCYAGHYNEAVNPGNRIPNPFPARGTVITTDYASHFNKAFAEFDKSIDDMIKACNGKVTLHLYFGDDDVRTDEIKKAQKNGRKGLFENW